MSLERFLFCFTFVQNVCYWFLKISLVSLFRRMARSRGGAAGGDAPRPADRAPAWGRRRTRGRERAAASVQEREEVPQPVADPSAIRIPDQPVGPSQPPPGLVLTPDLQAAISQLLGVLGGMQQPPAPATPALVPQDQPSVRAPQV